MVFFTIIIVVKYFLGLEKCPLFEDAVANGTAGTWDEHQAEHNYDFTETPNAMLNQYLM